MSNHHIHPTIAQSLIPFCVRVRTETGERGCLIEAPDSIMATKIGVQKMNIRDEEIPTGGLAISVEVTK